jgi:hypothetical protein
VREPEGERPLGRPKSTWGDNIEICLKEREWEGVGWIYLAQNICTWRVLANSVTKFRVSEMVANFLTSWGTIIFWRTVLRGVSYVLGFFSFLARSYFWNGSVYAVTDSAQVWAVYGAAIYFWPGKQFLEKLFLANCNIRR